MLTFFAGVSVGFALAYALALGILVACARNSRPARPWYWDESCADSLAEIAEAERCRRN